MKMNELKLELIKSLSKTYIPSSVIRMNGIDVDTEINRINCDMDYTNTTITQTFKKGIRIVTSLQDLSTTLYHDDIILWRYVDIDTFQYIALVIIADILAREEEI